MFINFFQVFTFFNFIFCPALLVVAYLRCRQYVGNSTAALTTHTHTHAHKPVVVRSD